MAREHGGGSPKPHHHTEPKRKRLSYIFGISTLCVLFYTLGAWQGKTTIVANKLQNQNNNNNSNKIECTNSNISPENHQSSSSESSTTLDFESHHHIEMNETENETATLSTKEFPPCNMSYSEYTPCQDPRRGRKFDRYMLKYRERHCPVKQELMQCLIPPPPKYKTPFKWPQSRDYAWYDNIPHKELSIEKAIQNWIQVEGDRFRFPGGGTMFPRGC
ncbi:putative methyltransferase PMT17 [Bienertia sinuspersici]